MNTTQPNLEPVKTSPSARPSAHQHRPLQPSTHSHCWVYRKAGWARRISNCSSGKGYPRLRCTKSLSGARRHSGWTREGWACTGPSFRRPSANQEDLQRESWGSIRLDFHITTAVGTDSSSTSSGLVTSTPCKQMILAILVSILNGGG